MQKPPQFSAPSSIFPDLKVSYCALSEPGPAMEMLGGKLFCFFPDFV